MMKIRNIAIVAHVDHGKTTLVDAMLKQTGVFRENQKVVERVMDSNELEREKGITIFSKNASLNYKGYKINIVDTPGHADFSGEVQRILKMVDSILLLVDAFEGPMPQTKYVLKKSLELGLNPIVVINKIDRENASPLKVVDKIFDLFIELNANDEQLDFPIVYASAKNGLAGLDIDDKMKDLTPLLDTIIENVKEPDVELEKPFQFLTSAVEYNNYLGKIATGKIHSGTVKVGQEVALIKRDGKIENHKITKIFTYNGLKKKEIEIAHAGDIVSIAGINDIDLGETIADPENPEPLPLIDIDEPTISITFLVNDSPFAGKEGKYLTTRNLWDRLQKELQNDASLKIELTSKPDAFLVKGRGELQLAILIEKIRREGFEFQVSKPSVILKEINGKMSEPIEIAVIDVADEYAGKIIELMGKRKGELIDMSQGSDGYSRLEFKIPTRGLIGFTNEFLTITKGTGTITHSFYEYEFYKGDIPKRTKGVLVALEEGTSVAYALNNLKSRGRMFIGPQVKVYEGMIVGEHNKERDLVVNVNKTKKLTNMRAAGSDENIKLPPPVEFSLQQAIEYIEDDELLEITPKSFRMRKKILSATERKKYNNSIANSVA